MARRLFITGITGFVGSHLAERAIASGDEVHGLAHEAPPHPNLAAVAREVAIHTGDLTDPSAVGRALAESRPDVVIHLAGQAVPSLAADDPRGALRVNVVGTAILLRAIAAQGDARLVFASSAEVYGAPERVPVDERSPPRPPNVYAATKALAEALVREGAGRARGATILRAVNGVGPRQHPGLAASAFARQIAQVEAGLAEPVIRHGRLDAERDLLDVRDMAEAYLAASALEDDGVATYNVGTGEAISIGELLGTLVALARVPVRTELDPSRVRADDPVAFTVDATRFRERTGWAPRIPLARSLSDLLDHWRSALAAPEPVRR